VRLLTLAVGMAIAVGPTAYATAEHGTLQVTSGVAVTQDGVQLRGGWHDTSRPCGTKRALKVRGQVQLDSHRVVLSKTFKGGNCTQVGFTPTAHLVNFDCPSGAWKPGDYRFTITTTDAATKLKATATLSWTQTDRC
jgi:hypothetical protein